MQNMRNMNPLLMIDFYKSDHRRQYPKNTELVYSNFTARKSRVENADGMVFFGLQYFVKEYLIDRMNENFFSRPKNEVVKEYRQYVPVPTDHIEELHDLGYLPLVIKAVPEGTLVPFGVPAITLYNTHPKFFWLTNYVETLISNILWKPCTSASTARLFRNTFKAWAERTGVDVSDQFIDWQGHDFSFRGMSGIEDAALSGAGHLLYFTGTDTVPAIYLLENYYNHFDNPYMREQLVGASVPATEHSVMCAGGKEGEMQTLNRLLDLYPSGILSVVSDTWDLFKLVSEYLPALKERIMARDGKLVVRPDSGTPHKILNGDPDAKCELEKKGVVKLLDETFGSIVNSKGFKTLDSHIGTIYGDGINREELVRILSGLADNGYASVTTVIGMGSYTYEYVTRDTYGTVCKATYCEIDGIETPISKSPKTGGWKKSHNGLLRVDRNNDGQLFVTENVSRLDESGGFLKQVFNRGNLEIEYSLKSIRNIARQ